MKLHWKTLIDVRERQKLAALEQVARDREVAEASQALALRAKAELVQCQQAKAGHWQATAGAVNGGACNVGQLRSAAHWSGALDRQIAQAQGGVQKANDTSERHQKMLDVSRQQLRVAASGIEKARQMQQRERTEAQRLAGLRLDDITEELSAQAWAARRRGA